MGTIQLQYLLRSRLNADVLRDFIEGVFSGDKSSAFAGMRKEPNVYISHVTQETYHAVVKVHMSDEEQACGGSSFIISQIFGNSFRHIDIESVSLQGIELLEHAERLFPGPKGGLLHLRNVLAENGPWLSIPIPAHADAWTVQAARVLLEQG